MASFSRTLAIDLGASAVRLAEMAPDSKGRPMVMGLAEAEIVHDSAKSPDLFPLYSQALGAALGRMSSKTRQCHLCLGGPAVFSRILKVPAMDPGKVSSMIGFEAKQAVPAIEQALWDYQLLSSAQPGEVEALVLAIKKEAVEEMSAAAAAVGLKPVSVTLAPAALLNAFYFNYPQTTGSALLLDIGSRATLIVLVEGSRLFVRVVPLGGGAVSQAVATDLQESLTGAELLKKAKGFVHPGGAYEDPADAVAARISKLSRGVMTRLHAEVERSITFFRSQQGGSKPARAWLAGGGALLGYTDLFFREKLQIPVEFFQPFRRLGIGPGVSSQTVAKDFPCWGVAVGAGLQALPDPPVRINVLGTLARAEAEKRKDVPAYAVGALAAAGLLFLPGVHGAWQAAKMGEQLAGETQRVEEASQVLEKGEAANKKLLGTLQELEMAASLEKERWRWPGLLAELKKNSPPRLWITSLRVVPMRPDMPGGTEGGKAGPGGGAQAKGAVAPSPVVEIGGMFETQSEKADAQAVQKFQQALDQGGVLQKVVVLERETPLYREGKTDQVALKFRLQAEWPLVLTAPKPSPGGSP